MTDGPSPTPAGGRPRDPLPDRPSTRPRIRQPRNPNYAARRMLVSTICIVVAIGAGVAIWSLTREEDDTVVAGGGDWDALALVDRTNGAITPVDKDGEAGDPLPGSGRVTAVHSEGDHIALVGTNQVVVTTLGSDEEPVTVPVTSGGTVTRLPVDDGLWLAIATPSGGNIVLVDGENGDTIDIGALAGQSSPRLFVDTLRHDAEGSVFAVADAVNFQTLVVHPGDEAAGFLRDQPIAVGDDGLVVTSQVVGQRADVTLFKGERDVASVQTGLPAGGVITDGKALIVTVDGQVLRFGDGDEQAEQIGSISVPSGATIRWVRPIADGSRLVVFGDVFEAVLDLSGETLFTTTFPTALEQPTIDPGWRCLPVGSGSTYHSLIEVDKGEQLADLTGLEVTGTSADGCAVIALRGAVTELVGDGGKARLGALKAAWLAPDGKYVVQQASDGAVTLVPIDEWRPGEAIELSAPASPSVIFTGG